MQLCVVTLSRRLVADCSLAQALSDYEKSAEALEHAVDGLDSDGDGLDDSSVAASAGLAARKRKGKPFPEVHIPSRPGMKTSPGGGVHIKTEGGSSGSSASGASAMPSGGPPSLGDMTGGGLDSPWRLLNDKGALTSMPSFGGGTPMNLASLMPQAQQSPGGILPDISGDMGNLSDTPALGSLQGISGWSNSPGAPIFLSLSQCSGGCVLKLVLKLAQVCQTAIRD